MSLPLPPLPYALDALEPHISRRTLAAHQGRHHAAYMEKTRSLVRGTILESCSLDTIVRVSAQATGTSLQRSCPGMEPCFLLAASWRTWSIGNLPTRTWLPHSAPANLGS